MKPIIIGLLLCALALPTVASAQVFYVFPRAKTQDKGQFSLGPMIAFADNDLIRLEGYGRTYLMDYLDGGVELIIDNVDGDFRWGAGFDLKYQLIPNNSPVPFDLSANAGLGFTSGNNLTTINIPFGGVISVPSTLKNGASLEPYAGVYLVYTYTSFDPGGGVSKSTDNSLDVEARLGLAYGIRENRQLFTTLHVGLDTALYIGFNFDLEN